jgi:hypothetical protein
MRCVHHDDLAARVVSTRRAKRAARLYSAVYRWDAGDRVVRAWRARPGRDTVACRGHGVYRRLPLRAWTCPDRCGPVPVLCKAEAWRCQAGESSTRGIAWRSERLKKHWEIIEDEGGI